MAMKWEELEEPPPPSMEVGLFVISGLPPYDGVYSRRMNG